GRGFLLPSQFPTNTATAENRNDPVLPSPAQHRHRRPRQPRPRPCAEPAPPGLRRDRGPAPGRPPRRQAQGRRRRAQDPGRGGPTEAKAKADGFTVKAPAEAVKEADLVAVLTPDMVQRQVYEEALAPNMKPGACLLFAHGLNVHYGLIAPREDLDVILVAPK